MKLFSKIKQLTKFVTPKHKAEHIKQNIEELPVIEHEYASHQRKSILGYSIQATNDNGYVAKFDFAKNKFFDYEVVYSERKAAFIEANKIEKEIIESFNDAVSILYSIKPVPKIELGEAEIVYRLIQHRRNGKGGVFEREIRKITHSHYYNCPIVESVNSVYQ